MFLVTSHLLYKSYFTPSFTQSPTLCNKTRSIHYKTTRIKRILSLKWRRVVEDEDSLNKTDEIFTPVPHTALLVIKNLWRP